MVTLNPTGSFKARGLSAAISVCAELGVTRAVIPSAGNAAGALAAYAAAAGIEATIFMPSYAGSVVFTAGTAIAGRFLYYYFFTTASEGKIQSLILSAVLMIVGFQVVMIALLADVLSGSRKLLEDLLYRVRRMELETTRREPISPGRTTDGGA